MDRRLTVIIPGYNTCQGWWQRCVKSVRNACGPQDEIICVDDGSKVPVQEDWVGVDVDDRIRLIRKENGGLSSARNMGLELARGRYVTFVDSDDEVMPNTYNMTIEKMKDTDSSVGIFGVKTIWVKEGLAKIDLPDNYDYGMLWPRDIVELSKRCLFNYACNKVYDIGKLIAPNHEWNFRFDLAGMPNEDVMFNLECVMASGRWCSVKYCGYTYYRQGMTLLSSYKPTNCQGYINCTKVWKRYFEFATSHADGTLPENVCEWIRNRTKVSDGILHEIEWRNIWMPGSPYSFFERWQWLRMVAKYAMPYAIFKYVGMTAHAFLRYHFYIRPIRRWNIWRMYPQAVEWNGDR